MTSAITRGNTSAEPPRARRRVGRWFGAALVLLATGATGATAATPQAGRYGQREPVALLIGRPLTLTAALDPRSAHTTLRVQQFKYSPLAAGLDVGFTVEEGGAVALQRATLQLPVVRDLHVKRHNGGIAHVPVVLLPICLGTHEAQVRTRLVLRNDLAPAPALTLGAAALRQLGVHVDPHREFTSSPTCGDHNSTAIH
ncbi:MAG TPA: hypothetical protein VFQ88_03540 [Nevskiaceae bacterium]|nr:hypothetical protein [Nevskiaceae bacterium]